MEHQPGDVIDKRFEIVEVLGRGHLATTYAAAALDTGREVVIKHMDLVRVDNWEAVKLFQRESDTLRQLDHPSIPNYVDFITYDDGQVSYLVQELAPGADLERILRAQGRFDEQMVRHVAEQALEILVYLGSRRPPVIHRDIKPENLLLDEDDRLYLVDFGAVRDRARRASERSQTMAGTMGYMAPEQLRGRAIVASDLYALGMTLIHLLTGEHPNEFTDHQMRVDFQDRVDASPAFCAFLTRLVEPMPDDRFTSAREALSALTSPLPPPTTGLERKPSSDFVAEHALPDDREVRFHLLEMSYETGSEAAKDWVRDTFDTQGARLHWLNFVSNIAKRRSEAKRVSHLEVDDDDEIVVDLDGESLWKNVIGYVVFALVIAAVGSVIFVAGDPFLGRFWFVFADDWLARSGLWFGAFLLLGIFFGFVARAHPMRIHLADGQCTLTRSKSGEVRWRGNPRDLDIYVNISDEGKPTIRFQTTQRMEYFHITEHPDDLFPILRLREVAHPDSSDNKPFTVSDATGGDTSPDDGRRRISDDRHEEAVQVDSTEEPIW